MSQSQQDRDEEFAKCQTAELKAAFLVFEDLIQQGAISDAYASEPHANWMLEIMTAHGFALTPKEETTK